LTLPNFLIKKVGKKFGYTEINQKKRKEWHFTIFTLLKNSFLTKYRTMPFSSMKCKDIILLPSSSRKNINDSFIVFLKGE
jgi:hypothetical protein